MTENRVKGDTENKNKNTEPTAVIFGGTVEGRLLAERFAGSRLRVHVSVATEYGASLLPKADNLSVHWGRMDGRGIERFLEETGCGVCIDATHPYAAEATVNIRTACKNAGVEYLRVLRKTDSFAGQSKTERDGGEILFVDSVRAAAEYLADREGNILITTGSKELSEYTVIPGYRDRCFARVLPTLPVMESCKALGFEGRNLIGMQGPFSEEMNLATIRQCGARYMVTKQSGANGGYGEKCEAALRAGIRLVVVGAPDEADGVSLEEAVSRLCRFGGSDTFDSERPDLDASAPNVPEERVVSLIGMGPGDPKLCTGEAAERLKQAEVLIGAERVLKICDRIGGEAALKPRFVSYRAEEIADFLRKHPEYRKIALVFSGDIGYYSGARRAAECLGGAYRIERIPGLSSPVYFLDRLGVSWSEVFLASRHGQRCDVVAVLRERQKVCLLLGKKGDVPEICAELIAAGMGEASLTVGERLSYENERIVGGTAQSLAGQVFDPLSVVYIEWGTGSDAQERFNAYAAAIRDGEFIRGKVPMTKEEVRTISLSKLGITDESVLYDIGAGTGSVSVTAAVSCPGAKVYAFEKNPEALELIGQNIAKFGARNIEIIAGDALERLETAGEAGAGPTVTGRLPAPTHVFVGGSGGRLREIVGAVRARNVRARFVVNAVTLETLENCLALAEEYPEYGDMEIVQMGISRGKSVGKYHMMTAENPIYIISFGKNMAGPEAAAKGSAAEGVKDNAENMGKEEDGGRHG